MPKGNPGGYAKPPRKGTAKKKIPAKNTIKKFDFTGTGRGPMPVRKPLTRRPLTGGPAKSPYKGMEVGGKGGMPRMTRRKKK